MSTRSLGTLTIDLVTKTGMFEKGMDRAARSADKSFRDIERKAKIAGAAIGGALVAGVSLIVRNTMEAEKQLAQLDAILASTGEAAGLTRDQLVKMAQQLQDRSTFGSSEIIEAQTRLLSYSGVLGENIPRAMQAIIDQSARLGMSLTQSAETIGRALESPAKAAAALAQQGFGAAFTDEVRATIDALVEAGRESEAQIMILEILEESYGGAAEASRSTLGGALTALRKNLETLMTGGPGTLDGATEMVNKLNDALSDPEVRKSIDDLITGIGQIGSVVTTVIPPVLDALGRLRDLLGGLEEQSQAVGRGIKGALTFNINEIRAAADDYREASMKIDSVFAERVSGPDFSRVRGSVDRPSSSQIDTSDLDIRTRKQKQEAEKAAKEAERDANRLERAILQMDKAQRQWQTTLDGSGNYILDDYARRLDEITSRSEEFARVGVPAERVAEFTANMERLAASIRDKDLADFSREFDWATRELEAGLEGAGTAAIQYERALFDLDEQMKQNLITEDQYARRLQAIQDQRFSGATGLLDDMRFELELMKMTNAERATAIQLRGLDAESVQKYGDEIRAANERIEQQMEQLRLMDDVRGEFQGFFADILTGTESVSDAFKNMLTGIANAMANFASQRLVEQLFGQFGTASGGTTGWASIFSGLFGGGRAGGGMAYPNKMFEVNERGFEMASVGGRDYLLTGNKAVKITPNHAIGAAASIGGGDTNVTVNIHKGAERDDVQTTQTPGGMQIDVWIEGVVKRSFANGRMDQVMGSRYGMRNRGVSHG